MYVEKTQLLAGYRHFHAGRISRRILLYLAIVSFFYMLLVSPVRTYAAGIGSGAYIEDEAELFTPEEEEEVRLSMQTLAIDIPVEVYTTENASGSTENTADRYFDETIGDGESGIVFIIDMDNREIYIWMDGEARQIIGDHKAETITDNVYRMASAGDYSGCAVEVMKELTAVWQGQAITEPMKHISLALISVAVSLIVNFFLISFLSRKKKTSDRELIMDTYNVYDVRNIDWQFAGQTKTYSPQSSGSGSSGGSSGGGGGSSGGGGGSSGGGGGHGF